MDEQQAKAVQDAAAALDKAWQAYGFAGVLEALEQVVKRCHEDPLGLKDQAFLALIPSLEELRRATKWLWEDENECYKEG